MHTTRRPIGAAIAALGMALVTTLVVGAATTATPAGADGRTQQTITFGPLADREVGTDPELLTATTTAELKVSYTTAGGCSIYQTFRVRLDAAGPCTVTAHQPGNSAYAPAADVSQTFTISPSDTGVDLQFLSRAPGLGDEIIVRAAVFSATGKNAPRGSVTFTATPPSGPPRTFTADLDHYVEARWFVSDWALGTTSVVVTFAGNDTWRSSTSAPRSIRVLTEPEIAVADTYETALGREPSAADLAFWSGRLATRSASVIADSIARTPEGRAQLVTLTYHKVFRKTASRADRAYWSGELMAGRITPEGLTAYLYSTVTADPVNHLYWVHLWYLPSEDALAFWGPRTDTAVERKQASLTVGRTSDAVRALVGQAAGNACGASPLPGAIVTAATDLARATAYDLVRVAAWLRATHCPRS